MILTTCAACAAPLAHDAPRCVRCKVRYCDSTCQHDHWRRGHKQMCKKIHRGGNAEQYNANKKYKEAVAVAVEACAKDTKGQTCYICLQAVHSRTGEGLVRGCACGDRDSVASGRTGVAHVSCLAEQAKVLLEEAEENNMGIDAYTERWDRWQTCSLCKQQYHGVVACALGWACWKAYLGRPEKDLARHGALTRLGNGLRLVGRAREALTVFEAGIDIDNRSRPGCFKGDSEHYFDASSCHDELGNHEKALEMKRHIYDGQLKRYGIQYMDTLITAESIVLVLLRLKRYEEARTFVAPHVRTAQRTLGPDHDITLRLRVEHAQTIVTSSTLKFQGGVGEHDLRKALDILDDTCSRMRRILGDAHPHTIRALKIQDQYREMRPIGFVRGK